MWWICYSALPSKEVQMKAKAHIFVNGQKMFVLPANITAEELVGLCTTKKKIVISAHSTNLEEGSIRWDVSTKPRTEIAQKSLIRFF